VRLIFSALLLVLLLAALDQTIVSTARLRCTRCFSRRLR
jgi:hypothetical protein